ncbi:MAG: hypothetical protein V4636_08895 [Pseudomonadota bacterium]
MNPPVVAGEAAGSSTSYSASSTAAFGGLPPKSTGGPTNAAASGFSADPADALTLRKRILTLPIFHTGIGNLFHRKPKESMAEQLHKQRLEQFAERFVEYFNRQPPNLDAALKQLPADFSELTRTHRADTQLRTDEVRTLVAMLIEKGKIKPRGQEAAERFMTRLQRHAELIDRFPCHIPNLVLSGRLQETFEAGGWMAVEHLMEKYPPDTREWNKRFDAIAGVLPVLFRAGEISKELYLKMRDSLSDFHGQLSRVPNFIREGQDLECAQLLSDRNQSPANLPLLSNLVGNLPATKDSIGWYPFANGGGVSQTVKQFVSSDLAGGTAIVRRTLHGGPPAFDVFQDGKLIIDARARQGLLDSILKQ